MFRAVSAYDRFMGRYSDPLAPRLCDFAGVTPGQRALDVGSGPGALTGELVRRLGAASVLAADPSEPFVQAVRERHPGVDARVGVAEQLPFPDRSVDVTLAQLVVHFLRDPVAGCREMRRVTRPGGVVAACVWDFAGGGGPLSRFWEAARELDPEVDDESAWSGTREGQLAEYLTRAGLTGVEQGALVIEVEHESFEAWWEPYTLGAGPAGAFVAGLEPEARQRLRRRCRDLIGDGPGKVRGRAWCARGYA